MTTLTKAPDFQSVVTAVEAQDKLNFDLTTSLKDLRIGDGGMLWDSRNEQSLGFTTLGLAQFARKIELPGPYAARLLQQDTELFARNVRHGLVNTQECNPATDLLFRCTKEDGIAKVRAVLTNKYGIIDNAPALSATLDAFRALGLDELSIEGFSLSPNSFHLRLGDKKHAIDAAKAAGQSGFIKDADFLYAMLHFYNSEVGTKSIGLDGGVYRVVCTNGLVKPAGDEAGFKKRHFGYTTEELTKFVVESAERILTGSQEFAAKFAEGQNIPVEQAETTLKNLFGRARVSRKDEKAILAELATQFEGMDLNLAPVTQYDVVNAITATARELDTDERVTLERLAATLVK